MRPAPSDALLALDLGASKFAYCLSRTGVPGRVTSLPLPVYGDTVREFEVIARALADDASTYGGVPVLCAAPSLSGDGVVESWPNRPHWRGFPLLTAVQDVLGSRPATVGDGDAIALADAGGRPGAYYISLYFGTGVAGGIVRDHDIVRLGPLNSELGHIPTDPGGAHCSCGLRGCFQTVWIAWREGRAGRDEFTANLARLVATLSRVFPACTISLGGRFFSEDRAKAAALLDDVLPAVGASPWAPTLRLSDAGVHGPLTGALIIARRLRNSDARRTD
ncbi:MAG: ROK family protein [Microbispora sp.]|nr:ROK family protein [Microbispora sp.]